ncbi:MAG: SLBB domain-containing protein [Chitinophagaceae bacterium]|nr:SLBB domain-containing protein [Chitinophagaceae bacterium]MCW5904039.1 SLBB domain-containing protein [Chitinophagaceae bacterium]
MLYKIRFLITAVLLCFTTVLTAQLPNNLSRVKSSDITDAQLQEFITKAQNSGLSEDQVIQELQRRRMPTMEIESLKTRIAALISPSKTPANSTAIHESRSSISVQTPEEQIQSNTIFGSELFSNPSLSFEPDLRLPTPKNYTLGPDDKLLLDIYGTNISQQSLMVNAEGTVYIKYAGPVQVNGLTIEEASKIINTKLSKYYPAITTGQTKVILSLTGIRAIKVMVLGAVKKPGTYSLSSLATLFNALYVSGGPTDNGSFRNIELVRNNKVIVLADLYDFLLNSNQKANVRLMDNDVIKIPFAKTQIDITGEVNRPGIFEMQATETLQDAINFAGGYKSNAFKARITGLRNTDFDRLVLDIIKDSIAKFIPQNGDSYTIGSIINKFQNRLIIEGAVFKPGNYSLDNNKVTITDLLQKAEGLREDAYTGRALVIRTKEDLTKEVISINLATDSGKNFILQKEDVLQVSSIFDIKDNFPVNIHGAVRKPGVYTFDDSLSLKALILKAGGFAENATGMGIEIARRKRDVEVNNPQSPIVEIIKIDDDKDLSNPTSDVQLKPFDIVTIKIDPYYKSQITVSIEGEVLIPGVYTLTSRVEKISDLIKRAGGTLYTANINGARLIRVNKLYENEIELAKKIAQSSAHDSSNVVVSTETKHYKEVAINLEKIMKSPGSKEDILLEEGDKIEIPTINNMVTISGEVFNPLIISYDENKKLREYLYDAGGVAKSGNKKRIFVVYPNGKAGKTKKILGIFRKYPEVTAGSKIFVPKEPEKKETDYAKTSIIITGLSAFITAVALAFQITK